MYIKGYYKDRRHALRDSRIILPHKIQKGRTSTPEHMTPTTYKYLKSGF